MEENNEINQKIEKLYLNDIINIELNATLNGLENNNNIIKEKFRLGFKKSEYIKNLILNIENNKKEFVNRGLYLLLSISITIGSGIGVYKVAKRIGYRDYYNKDITTYSTWKGLDNNEVLVCDSEFNEEELEKVYLNVYDSWEAIGNGYKRNIKKYDVSDYKFQNIEDYLDYSIDYYNVEYETVVEESNSISLSSLYPKDCVEVEKFIIDNSEVVEKFDFVDFTVAISLLYCLYLFVLYGVIYFTEEQFIFGQCSELIDILKKNRRSKKITKMELKKLEKINNEIINIVNSNEILKKNFNMLYEENKFLLDNPDELYDRFNYLANEIGNIKVKRLVKKA